MMHGLLAAAMILAGAAGADVLVSPDPEFTAPEILAWEAHSFEGWTSYTLDVEDGRQAVRAECRGGTASGLFLREDIDLDETPILEWQWKASDTPEGVDEQAESGDDFALRIYLIDERSLLRWRSRAINYVWSADQPRGSAWPNPHQSNARMVAVRSDAAGDAGAWHRERRNVRRDFRELHDVDVSTLSAVAIMTDCDQTGQATGGWYGTLRFVPPS